ncbi:hypothetical protein [Reyranella sp.]
MAEVPALTDGERQAAATWFKEGHPARPIIATAFGSRLPGKRKQA